MLPNLKGKKVGCQRWSIRDLIILRPNFEISAIVVPVAGAGQIFTAGESAGERGLAARVR